MKTLDLINSQYINNNFNRMDLVVRFMYVKEYVEKNNVFDANNIYLYMIERRGCFKYKPPTQWLLDFNNTIDSMIKNGFDEKFPIMVNENNLLWDGSHRLSISFGLDFENVNVEVMDPPKIGRWGFDWFIENNFKKSYLNQINLCFEKYFKVIR